MEKITIQNIRDVLLIIGIFLFFTGWIYVYYYYDYFGISFSSVEVDYTSYIVYSFIVCSSFSYIPLLVLLALAAAYYFWIKKSVFSTIICSILLFPGLFLLAQKAAFADAAKTRLAVSGMREIQFVFRSDADVLGYKNTPDSLGGLNRLVKNDVPVIKNAVKVPMRLLGENDNCFILLNQPPQLAGIPDLPVGCVYFINKKDVLFSKIILR